jgi:putative chitinase
MSDLRASLFSALRAFAPGGSIPPADVKPIDDLADRWGIPRNGGGYPWPISAIDVSLLRLISHGIADEDLAAWVEPIRAACARFEINTIRRISAFLTTLAHEGGFKVGARENMNYSAKRMAQVWPSRFRGPNALANRLHRQPEKIANIVYADRMGNGGPETGDGWRFRGIGPIQLTGRSNWEAFASAMEMTLDEVEAYMLTIEGGVMSAAWFWETNDINRLADTPGVEDETRRINGGLIGVDQRRAIFDRLVDEFLRREK